MNSSSPSSQVNISHQPRIMFGLLLFTFAFLFSRASDAQVLTGTLRCGTTDTINIGPVLNGVSLKDSLSLINNFHASETSWKVTGASSIFSLSDSTGTADSGSAWIPIVTTFISDTSHTGEQVFTTFSITPDSLCTAYLYFVANIIGPTTDSSTFLLPNTSKEVIAIQSNTDSTSRHFYFKNNGDSSITIDSIRIIGTSAFLIDSAPPHFFTLNRSDSFAIRISYHQTSPGSDNGDLFMVSRPDEPILPAIALQGVRTAVDAVQIQPAGTTYIWLYPNPAQGPVTIHTENLTSTHVTITDVLGRAKLEASFHGDWQWDRQNDGGGMAPAGTYFLIVTGTDANGKAVHQVGRIVLE